MDTNDPKEVAAAYGLPANNATYHLLAVLRALEENKVPALLTAITDKAKEEYELMVSIDGLASQSMIASFGLRYGVFVLLLSSMYREEDGPEADPHDLHLEEIKAMLQRGARNLSKMYLLRVEEGGNG